MVGIIYQTGFNAGPGLFSKEGKIGKILARKQGRTNIKFYVIIKQKNNANNRSVACG